MYKLLIIGLLFFGACEKVEFSSETISDKNLPTKQAENVRIVTTNGDKIEEEMTAVHFDEYESGLIVADTVFIKNFNEDGSLKFTLKSDKIKKDDTKNLLIALGNVIVTSDNGVLKTPYLEFNEDTEIIVAKEKVVLERENNILYGKELTTDINFEKIEIIQVSAEGKIDEENIDW
ncbi:MAG: LPS export ABC transporter periplasmic protein LptC [Candidatus Cloacimonetes bacterium]|nr:LPS export ABC transporter periplasmic protein LptC [Candidatus Cloacimonadota bacterium]